MTYLSNTFSNELLADEEKLCIFYHFNLLFYLFQNDTQDQKELSSGYEVIEVPCLIKIKQVFAVIDEVRCYFVQFSRITKVDSNFVLIISQKACKYIGVYFLWELGLSSFKCGVQN